MAENSASDHHSDSQNSGNDQKRAYECLDCGQSLSFSEAIDHAEKFEHSISGGPGLSAHTDSDR
jgi:hypothetical protein